MATIETKECDVTGVRRGVDSYRVTVEKVTSGLESETLMGSNVDLCDKALDRLTGFILRGCTPPPPRTKKGEEVDETEAEPPREPPVNSDGSSPD